MTRRGWEHSQKCVTDGQTDGQTDRQTENTICRAAWSQLKKGYIVPGDYLFNSSGTVHRKEIYQISYVVFDKIVQGWFHRTDERFGKNWRNTGQKLYPMSV